MANTFKQAYHEVGVPAGLPAECEAMFAAWYDLLVRWNAKINLTRVAEPVRAVAYHLADGVPLAKALEPGATLLDVGAGVGIPGLIVAALRSDCVVTLVESSAKKAAFLTQAVSAMKLTNARVVDARAETLRERFDVVAARAVDKPVALASDFGHLIKADGRLAVFLAEADPPLPDGWQIKQEIRYVLPAGEGPRRLLLLHR